MRLISKINSLLLLSISLISFNATAQSGSKFKVTLDAGHGGKDYGAIYNGHIEKNVALAVTLKVGKILESQPNVEVNYTRKTDVFIDLVERANIANRVNANVFVSMHCNANKNQSADGTETYVMGMTKNASSLAVAKAENEVVTLEKDYKQKYKGFDPNSPESMIGLTLMQEEFLENSISLASKVEDSFGTIGKKIRSGGVKQAPYMVLHKAAMPRVLIEMGFISNPIEGGKLDSEEGQNEIAHAIASAIMGYKKEYFGGSEGNVEKLVPKPIDKQKTDTPKTIKETPKIIKDTAKKVVPVVKNVDKIENTNGIVFKIQLAASGKKMELVSSNFKGLKNISMVSENKLYKYMYGNTSNYDEIKKQLQDAKSKGYISAFIIAFKDGKKIDVNEAIKQ